MVKTTCVGQTNVCWVKCKRCKRPSLIHTRLQYHPGTIHRCVFCSFLKDKELRRC
jgi:hypothetical protein